MAGYNYPEGGFLKQYSLPQQVGANGVLTFTFDRIVGMVFALSIGGDSSATVQETPTSTFGAPLLDGTPFPLPVKTRSILVWAPTGATVRVWGYA